MQKATIALTGVIVGLLIGFLGSGFYSSSTAEAAQAASYAGDGILDVGNGPIVGRDAIRDAVSNMPGGRHHIDNIVLKIDGDHATGRAAWLHTGKDSEGNMAIGGYGHYEDDLVKVDGRWLFKRRRIYNEGNEAWAAPPGNPAW